MTLFTLLDISQITLIHSDMSKQNIENSTLLVSIGENVRLLRKRKGFSQEKLAEMADLHTTTISEIECGKSNLTIISLERIAHALDSSITSLFPQPFEADDKLFNEQIKRILANHHELNERDKPVHGNVVKAIADAFENKNDNKKSLS
jgi:transcriptional regulator with XRE-family HTH domain